MASLSPDVLQVQSKADGCLVLKKELRWFLIELYHRKGIAYTELAWAQVSAVRSSSD